MIVIVIPYELATKDSYFIFLHEFIIILFKSSLLSPIDSKTKIATSLLYIDGVDDISKHIYCKTYMATFLHMNPCPGGNFFKQNLKDLSMVIITIYL